jgi:dihydroorotate dehydrogenase (fumarate)
MHQDPRTEYYREHLSEMAEICSHNGKPLVVSVAGFDTAEWRTLIHLCGAYGIKTIELNFGCPNAQSEHPIWSFDPFNMREITHLALDTGLEVGIKLSPFSNPDDLRKAAVVPKGTEYVATSNTFPNVPIPQASVPYGGMSGPALKPIALGQVSQLRQLLDSAIPIVGVGGIRSSKDICDYRDAGATAVQATTAYYEAKENPMVFSDILHDLEER